MSDESKDRWRDVSDRISNEREELNREAERQRLLDDLSFASQRNRELETAVAKLAREQDRLVLVERERIFKRAQAAQATAALVHEATWAKNRMENEMRLAKQRAALFPETVIPGSLGAASSAGTSNVSRPVRVSLPPAVREMASQASQKNIPAPEKEEIPEEDAGVASMVANVYTSAMGAFFSNPIKDVILKASARSTPLRTPAEPTPNIPVAPTANSVEPFVVPAAPVVAADPPIPRASTEVPTIIPTLIATLPTIPKVGSILPAKQTPKEVRRTVNRAGKGEWTSQELLDEAQLRMASAVSEQVEFLQSQREIMVLLFGLPKETRPGPVPTLDPGWLEMEAAWIEAVSKNPQLPNPLPEKELHPAIVAAMGEAVGGEEAKADDLDDENFYFAYVI